MYDFVKKKLDCYLREYDRVKVKPETENSNLTFEEVVDLKIKEDSNSIFEIFGEHGIRSVYIKFDKDRIIKYLPFIKYTSNIVHL
jgi:hypothetical protein